MGPAVGADEVQHDPGVGLGYPGKSFQVQEALGQVPQVGDPHPASKIPWWHRFHLGKCKAVGDMQVRRRTRWQVLGHAWGDEEDRIGRTGRSGKVIRQGKVHDMEHAYPRMGPVPEVAEPVQVEVPAEVEASSAQVGQPLHASIVQEGPRRPG